MEPARSLMPHDWTSQIEHLDKALRSSDLEALAIISIPPMKRVASLMQLGGVDVELASQRLAAAVTEIRQCIIDRDRAPNVSVFDDLQLMVPYTPPSPSKLIPFADRSELPRDSLSAVPSPSSPSRNGQHGQTQPGELFSIPDEAFRTDASALLGPSHAAQDPEEGQLVGEFLQAFAGDDTDYGALLATIESVAPPPGVADELGTLTEASADKGARVLMKGELHPGLLTDLVQLFGQNMETGCLRLSGDDAAQVYFRQGQVSHALCGDSTG
ncbi:MAG: DUF4388 domain-containing protein, partial [Myxococcota bacterium]